MYFRNQLLYDTLNQYQNIIIYGTGDFAHEIYPQLKKMGLKEKISCFAQTEKSDIDSIDGIPVVSIHSHICVKSECVVLIAVSEKYTNEIKQILLNYNYLNIVSLVDYRIDYKRKQASFRNLTTFEEYCECIADWYVKTHTGNPDKQIVLQELLDRGNCADKEVDRKLIVMICGTLSGRDIKFIEALKKSGYRIILLEYFQWMPTWCVNRLQNANIQIEKCHCIEEMLYRALQYHPLVYFFDPSWGDCLWAEIMIKNKHYF